MCVCVCVCVCINCQEYFTRESGHTDYLKENQWRWKVEWLTSNCLCKSLIEQQHEKINKETED